MGDDIPDWVPDEAPDWWDDASSWLTNPVAKITSVIIGYIVANVLVPIAEIAVAIADAILLVFLGPDHRVSSTFVFWSESSEAGATTPGAAELPLYAVKLIIASVEPIVRPGLVALESFNTRIEAILAEAGLAAAPAAALVFTLEAAIVLWVGYRLLQAVPVGSWVVGTLGSAGSRVVGVLR